MEATFAKFWAAVPLKTGELDNKCKCQQTNCGVGDGAEMLIFVSKL
jgi:hypothetical protein